MNEEHYWFRNYKENEKVDPNDVNFFGCLYGVISAIVMFMILVMCFLLGGCKSVKYVPVVTVHTDTCYITKQQRDSIWLHDSIFVSEKQSGDTIFVNVTKWHTKYQEKQVHDTLYISKIDSIPQPYPVEVKVEKPLSKWQKFIMNFGAIALSLLFMWIVWQAWKLYNHRF